MPKSRTARSLLATAVLAACATTAQAAAPPDIVSRGKYLVTAGDCAACHNAPGGQPLAGGYALTTPFGTMYTPNLTPDKATGLGNWSDEDFYRAMHDGRAPHGKFLYPGLPYPWFTRVTRADDNAIKAYLDTLAPVNAPQKQDTLIFPLSVRPVMLGWNTVFFQPGEFKPDPSQSDQVNRGAYLAQGLAHCGDCHTPKNIAQAPMRSREYAGELLNDWYAPNITSSSQGIGGWSNDELFTYLKTGENAKRGVVLGPMAETIHDSLSHLTDSDIHDIVLYLKATKPIDSYQPRTSVLASDQRPGAPVYASYCASCHQQDGQGVKGKIPALTDNGAVLAKGPQDVIRVVLGGVHAQGSFGPMPGFGTIMSDQQIADVTNYVRGAWANKAPETATADQVSAAAKQTPNPLSGGQTCPQLGTSPLDTALTDPASGIQPILQATTEANLGQSAHKILAILHAKTPTATRADIVNDTTTAYCPIVAANAQLAPIDRWRQLSEFGDELYTGGQQ